MGVKSGWEQVKNSRFYEEFYFIAIALILAFGVIQTTGTVLDTDKPVVTVVSCSMYPEYHVGDVIMVRGQDFEDITEGDVIVFDAESPDVNIPVIHRVVVKEDEMLETRGDNTRGQSDFEKNIRPEQVHGVAFLKIPRVGLLKLLAMDITGLSGQPFVIDSIPACQNVR